MKKSLLKFLAKAVLVAALLTPVVAAAQILRPTGGGGILQPGLLQRVGTALVPTFSGDTLGSSGTRWSTIFADTLNATSLTIGGTVTGNLTVTGDVAVNGGDLTTTATTFNFLAANATTVNLAGAATTLTLAGGSASTGCSIDNTGSLVCSVPITVAAGGTGAATLTGIVLGNGISAMTGLTTSAGIAGAISDEQGSGALVFATSPSLTTPDIGTATGVASNLTLAKIGSSTYSSVQHLQNLFHSSGWSSGGGITDDTDGTITVAAGTGFIRATDSETAEIKFTDWAAESGANVDLTDLSTNYVYVEYNAGAPRVIATVTPRTDINTNILLGNVYRNGTSLQINTSVRYQVVNHAGKMIQRMQAVEPYERESGAVTTETGTRNIAVSAGTFWEGLTQFTTAAFDSSGADRFTYVYRDGGGGWTEALTQSQINNTQYDDGDGGLGTLTAARYGVHWVYIETDGDVVVLYGQGDYLLAAAQDATPPSSLPPRLVAHGKLIAKIIIQKSAATFTSTESAFPMTFTPSLVVTHNDLGGLQGGAASEYYHLTSADYTGTGTGVVVRASSPSLTTPAIGAATGTSLVLTGNLSAEDLLIEDSNASHFLTITTTSDLTAGHTLTLVPGDADRSVTMAGNLNISGDLITSGDDSLTFTTAGATNVTLPTTGTLLANVSEDTSPTLGGSLDFNTNDGTNIDDLFFSAGSVLDFGTADVTVTHGTNVLDIAGGSLGIGAAASTSIVLHAGWNATTMPAATTAARQLQTSGNITELANATITDIVGAYFNTFTITDGGGTETVGTVSTVYIPNAPTVGTTPTNGPYSLFIDAGELRLDGSLGDTTNRVPSGFFTDLTVTNAIAGSITGNAATVTSFSAAGGSLTLSGADAITLTTTGDSNVTLPTTGTLVNDAVTSLGSLGTVSTALTGVLRADAGVLSADTDVTDIVAAASTTAAGKIEIAINTEVNTGTDATRAVSPDALAGSNLGTKVAEVVAFDFATATATGDGKAYFTVPASMGGMNLTGIHARVITAGTTNTTDVQINNVTQTADMLSTKVTIDSGETGSDTAVTAAVIDTNNDDVAAYDLLRIDVDAISTTPAQGLILTLEFMLP